MEKEKKEEEWRMKRRKEEDQKEKESMWHWSLVSRHPHLWHTPSSSDPTGVRGSTGLLDQIHLIFPKVSWSHGTCDPWVVHLVVSLPSCHQSIFLNWGLKFGNVTFVITIQRTMSQGSKKEKRGREEQGQWQHTSSVFCVSFVLLSVFVFCCCEHLFFCQFPNPKDKHSKIKRARQKTKKTPLDDLCSIWHNNNNKKSNNENTWTTKKCQKTHKTKKLTNLWQTNATKQKKNGREIR